MKTLQKFLGVGVAVALLGLSVVMADVQTDPARVPLKFSLDIGDGSVDLPEISFDVIGGVGGEGAQTTCAMTPGTGSSLLLNPPLITMQRPEQWSNTPRASLAPLGTLPPAQTNYPPRRRSAPSTPAVFTPPPIFIVDPDEDDEGSAQVPEPATLLIVGLGIGAVAVVRQRRKRNTRH